MPKAYYAPPEIILKLKDPFGTLIRGSYAETIRKLKDIIKKETPVKIISVGDKVSRNLHINSIIPQVSITDDLSMRRRLKPEVFPNKNMIKIKNPQGTITEEAIQAIKHAINEENPIHLFVDGEEDLLALVAILYAPDNSFVIYGQPRKGMVLVRINQQKKAEAEKVWEKMKPINYQK
jgi:GTP-dependent dephospho-CoA kinase